MKIIFKITSVACADYVLTKLAVILILNYKVIHIIYFKF